MREFRPEDEPRRLLDLGRRLTDECPDYVMWKNVDTAMAGAGDIDSILPEHHWPTAQDVFRAWALETGYTAVLECGHLPGSLLVVGASRSFSLLRELHLSRSVTFRGAEIIRAGDVSRLAYVDNYGLRRLRPGAEGFFVFLLNGAGYFGRKSARSPKTERAHWLMTRDPDGAKLAASLFGDAQRHALMAARAAATGEAPGQAFRRLEFYAVRRALTHPLFLTRRASFRAVHNRRCVVAHALSNGRKVPAHWSFDAWVTAAQRSHGRAV